MGQVSNFDNLLVGFIFLCQKLRRDPSLLFRFFPSPLFKNRTFRWAAVVVLFSVMIGRGLQNAGSIEHWGAVFWLLCLVTTAIVLVLAVIYRTRAWCAICPVGSVQWTLGGRRERWTIESTCQSCGLCEKHCPLTISIVASGQRVTLRRRTA